MKSDESSIAKLLRLSEEPCFLYNEIQIHNELVKNAVHFMQFLEEFYQAWGSNNKLVLLPKKQVFTFEPLKGDLRVMPCIIRSKKNEPLKVVKIIGTNEEEVVVKDKISVGKALLIHPTDNFVWAIFDVCSLSSFRTAAISSLAYHALVKDSQSPVGIIGAGRIGFYTALILHKWLKINAISISDTNPDHIKNLKAAAKIEMPDLVIKSQDLTELTETCKNVFLATTSNKPILTFKNSQKLQFISSVGADADNLSELKEDILKDRDIITDSKHSMMLGDMKQWKESKKITKKNIIELKNIIKTKHTISVRKKIFISTGVAVQDALVCNFLFNRFQKPGENLGVVNIS